MTPQLPPACAECMTVTQSAQPGALPQQSASQVFRAPDGKVRVDSGTTSMIMDPASKQAILIDHAAKVARAIPLPKPPQMPGAPPMPGLPGMPAMPQIPGMPAAPMGAVHVQDLGKALIEGHEVDGKKFTMQPPQMPSPPGLPQAPTMPQAPGLPQVPGMPQVPKPPMVSEVWTSSKLQMPVLTKTTGEFGQQVCHCKCSDAVPPPTMFQIPPGYRMVKAG